MLAERWSEGGFQRTCQRIYRGEIKYDEEWKVL